MAVEGLVQTAQAGPNAVIGARQTLLKGNQNAQDVVNRYLAIRYGYTIVAPQGIRQIDTFAFDYKGDEEVNIETEITDHWLEDNNAVQDHIGVKPIVITMKGFVSELNLSGTELAFLNKIFSVVTNKMSQVQGYLGSYTPGAVDAIQKSVSQAQNIAIQIEQAMARTAQIASYFGKSAGPTKQQQAFAELSALALGRVLFTVTTPYAVYDNMAILSLRVIQPAGTRGWSDFTVKMKQLKFASDITLPFYTSNNAGRTASAVQANTANGPTSGTTAPLAEVTGAFA